MLSVWLALSPASEESGCMRVMPGTHRGEVLPHDDRYHEDNMLTRGQEITRGVKETEAVLMPLEPGQISIHNYRIAHASGPNNSGDRRIGVSMHFMRRIPNRLLVTGTVPRWFGERTDRGTSNPLRSRQRILIR